MPSYCFMWQANKVFCEKIFRKFWLFSALRVSDKIFSELLLLGTFFWCLFHSLLSMHVFVSKLGVIIWWRFGNFSCSVFQVFRSSVSHPLLILCEAFHFRNFNFGFYCDWFHFVINKRVWSSSIWDFHLFPWWDPVIFKNPSMFYLVLLL